MIPYSGVIQVNGEAFNGTGEFKFAIVNQACAMGQVGCVTLWSNSSASVEGSEPANPVSITVNAGKYSVKLGDIGLTNMDTLPATVFDNETTYLRVWFSDSLTGSQKLTPDRQLVSVPYAYRAQIADQVATGTIGTSELASGIAGNGLDINAGAINIADRGVDTLHIADSAITDAKINNMDWSKLTDAPPGFADGVDNDTIYSADGGLSLNGTSISIAPSGVGSNEIATDAIGSDEIQTGAVSGLELALNSVEGKHFSPGVLPLPPRAFGAAVQNTAGYCEFYRLPSEFHFESSTNCNAYAMVNLPNGIQIDSLTCFLSDTSSEGYIRVIRILRSSYAISSTSKAEIIGEILSPTTAAEVFTKIVPFSIANIINNVIDNSKYSYSVQIQFSTDGVKLGLGLGSTGCFINYS